MPSTIAHSTGTITPTAVEGYRASRQARTIVHDVLNRANPDITFRAFGLRTGSLRLVFDDQANAVAALSALSVPQVLTVTNPDVEALSMAFVIADGELDIEQDSENATLWRILVPFQEVLP